MVPVTVRNFDYPAAVAKRQADLLAAMPRVAEEPALRQQGRWLVTDGVQVEEREGGVWRFTVTAYPQEPLRPAVACLSLPDRLLLPPGSFFRCSVRSVRVDGREQATVSEPRADPGTSSPDAEQVALAWRAENGNRYTLMPAQHYGQTWRGVVVPADRAPLWSFGRAALPWRLAENRLAALEFQFRPILLPATFEVRQCRLETYIQEAPTSSH